MSTNNMHIWLASFGRTASLQIAFAAELRVALAHGGAFYGWHCIPTLTASQMGSALPLHLVSTGTWRIRTVQERLGHSDVSNTMIYIHVLKVAAGGTASPLDALSIVE